MISPTCGSIWIPISRTMNTSRPVKRNFESATAAEERERDRDRDRHADDDHAVHDRAPEVRPVDRVPEVLERRVAAEPLSASVDDVASVD
jgi:hypothetical protein